MDFELKWVSHGSAEYDQTVALRRRVLREPLGLEFTLDELSAESDQHHLGAYLAGHLVGCLILSPTEGAMKMRQVAVDPDWHGSGFGGELVRESEAFARSQGANEMVLHARSHVIAFYERLGYAALGDEFEEVGIPHRFMRKSL
ncbi:MAG: GNAT family N-acetyltransferase [Chthonomonas sp.]|nr:GNAT family N-acetyltransferase [Chthonomonas sp.]